jgi:Zn-dependent protease
MRSMQDFLFRSVLLLVPLLLSLSVHEFAHALVADRLGDDTPRLQGRLTLNPLAHISWLGSVMLPLLVLWVGSTAFFAWAKPVQVSPLRVGRSMTMATGMLLISLAGPLSNLLLLLAVLGLHSALRLVVGSDLPGEVVYLLGSLAWVNLLLAVFNMLPLPPLDGSRLLFWLLPRSLSWLEDGLQRIAPLLLFALVLQGSRILGPLLIGAVDALDWLTAGQASLLVHHQLPPSSGG